MSLFVVGYGVATQETANQFKTDPKFRKATNNMLWALSAAEKALTMTRELPTHDIHLVLGTSHGELEVTKDFLFTLHSGGAARPFLFQNSLHNATAGFLALRMGLQNTSVTVSNGHLTGEKAIETARLLLQSKKPRAALVVCVEGHVESLWPASKLNYKNVTLRPGSAALILVNQAALIQFNLRALLRIDKTDFTESKNSIGGDFYDSNGLEEIISQVLSKTDARSPLILGKPDGQASEIYFQREL